MFDFRGWGQCRISRERLWCLLGSRVVWGGGLWRGGRRWSLQGLFPAAAWWFRQLDTGQAAAAAEQPLPASLLGLFVVDDGCSCSAGARHYADLADNGLNRAVGDHRLGGPWSGASGAAAADISSASGRRRRSWTTGAARPSWVAPTERLRGWDCDVEWRGCAACWPDRIYTVISACSSWSSSSSSRTAPKPARKEGNTRSSVSLCELRTVTLQGRLQRVTTLGWARLHIHTHPSRYEHTNIQVKGVCL